MNKLLVNEAARRLGCGVWTLQEAERRGIITPSRNRSGHRLYTEADLKAVVAWMGTRKMHRQKANHAA